MSFQFVLTLSLVCAVIGARLDSQYLPPGGGPGPFPGAGGAPPFPGAGGRFPGGAGGGGKFPAGGKSAKLLHDEGGMFQ